MTLSIEQIRATLDQYGEKSCTSGFQITDDSIPLGIIIMQRKGRMRFESTDGHLVMSGPIKIETIETFVENYWYWQKIV